MNKIKKIKISNYQSMREAEIELGNITVITGQTDSGKSAFMRGVKGLVTNQSGSDFITVGEEESTVIMDSVRWRKGNGVNEYTIAKHGEEPGIYQKCGKAVPDTVRDELGMGEVEFGSGVKTLLNFHEQMKPLFLVQGNPADNAKIIGSISNIHDIYNAIRDAETEARGVKRILNDLEDKIPAETEIVTELEVTYNNRKAKLERFRSVWNRAKELSERLSKAGELTERATALRNRLHRLQAISDGLTTALTGERLLTSAQALETALKRAKITAETLTVSERLSARLEGILTEHNITGVSRAMWLHETLRGLSGCAEAIKQKTAMTSYNKGIIDGLRYRLENEFKTCDVCGAEREHWNKILLEKHDG